MTFRMFLKRLDLITHLSRRIRGKRRPGSAAAPAPSALEGFGLTRGLKAYVPGQPTLIIGLHEASLTGAPLLGFNLGAALSQSHNILYWLGAPGPILEGLRPTSFLILTGFGTRPRMRAALESALAESGASIAGAFANSVETLPLAQAMDASDIPTVGLLHEFGEYTLPVPKVFDFFMACDQVVVPARLIAESAKKRIRMVAIGEPANLVIRHQGCLPQMPRATNAGTLSPEDILERLGVPASGPRPPIVLGAGFVHARKGVDLFLQTALLVKKRYAGDFRFVWVGEKAPPEADLDYTFWLFDAIGRAGLERHVFFLEVQQDLDALLGLSDVFFLPSRLDPFPNVVLDALKHDKHILCFDRATGAAEFLTAHGANATVLDYLDVDGAADAILERFSQALTEDGRNAGIAREELSFAAYVEALSGQLEEAVRMKRMRTDALGQIAQSGLFDPAFAAGSSICRSNEDTALRTYVSAELRGLHATHPYPGFNAAQYRETARMAAASPGVSLLHALRENPDGRPSTHPVVRLDEQPRRERPEAMVALHLHLHYGDLAEEFRDLLEDSGLTCDLFLSTHTAAPAAHLERRFWSCLQGRVEIRRVPNRGRDIGPLLTEFREPLGTGGYDVIAHVHGKKSLQFPPAFGEAWRRSLLHTLLGDRLNLARVLGLFADDPSLGLLFPEDPNPVGWGENRSIAQSLAERMPDTPSLPDHPIFPVGTMFWARPQALAPLWDLRLDWGDYPAEPLPFDGTLLHAIERLLPSLAGARGLGWRTVHRPGFSR